jgi:hypothetical protein
MMARTTFSGPVFSNAGFGSPIVYITAADPAIVDIEPGAQIVILSVADGGPASVTLRLPKVFTTDGQPFNITNADPRFVGIRGYILNYGSADHVLIGTDSQPVNGSATGVEIAGGTAVQYAGNGNPTAAWAATESALCTAV